MKPISLMRKVALDPPPQQCPPCPSSPVLFLKCAQAACAQYSPSCPCMTMIGLHLLFGCVCTAVCTHSGSSEYVCVCVHTCLYVWVLDADRCPNGATRACVYVYGYACACHQPHRHKSAFLCLCQKRSFPKAMRGLGYPDTPQAAQIPT